MGETGIGDGSVLVTWTVFYSPLDYPGLFVVRAFEIRSGQPEPAARAEVATALTLDDARASIPGGLFRLERMPGDHESVIETWI